MKSALFFSRDGRIASLSRLDLRRNRPRVSLFLNSKWYELTWRNILVSFVDDEWELFTFELGSWRPSKCLEILQTY